VVDGAAPTLPAPLTDDLVGFITLDSFRTVVPRCDLTGRVQKENCVVFDTFDQKAKDFVAVTETLLSFRAC